MNVLAWLRGRAAALWLATSVLVVLGLASALSMPSGIYPEVEFPRIVVVARIGGAPPDVFTTSVTRPLEQSLATVLGVQRIRSKTIRGATEVSLQFAPNTDMWRALQLVESRVNEARTGLPTGTELLVERVTTGSFPVVTFNLAGPIDPRELRELGEFVVRPALASVAGAGRVEVLGGDVREVEIVVDPKRAAALRLTPDRIADKLRTAMGQEAVGRVERDHQLVTVTADGMPRSLDDIRSMPVATAADGVAVRLDSVADVQDGAEDRVVRVGGPRGETVVISLARLPGASTTQVVGDAEDAARALGPSLPPGVTLTPVYDQARLVHESIGSVRDAILLGIVLCAVIIAVFLRDLRAGAVAALAVPLTLAITFAAMRVAGQTLNLMSLGGMAVAVGIVIDDAIVVVEAIVRRRDAGHSADEASTLGTLDLAPAVIGTTITTVVVFVPLAFLSGVVGDFFRALAFTLTTAVSLSLVIALALLPVTAGRFLRESASTRASRLQRAYESWVTRSVGRPWLALLALAGLLGFGVVVAPRVERGFLPQMDEGAFVLDYFLPAGTSLATTEGYARKLEEELRATPEVQTFSRRLGAELGPAAATQLNRGDIMVSLLPAAQRNRSSEEVIADVRLRIERSYPEVRVEFVQVLQDVLSDLAGNPRPIEVKVFGPDYAELHRTARAIAERMRPTAGLVDLYDGEELESPELRHAMRREDIARLGTTPDEVTSQLATGLTGSRVGFIRRFDRLVAVRVRYPNAVRFDEEKASVMPLLIGERTVRFDAVTSTTHETSPSILMHEALGPMVAITADHEDRDVGSIADEIERRLRGFALPPNVRLELGGQARGQRDTLRELAIVGALAAMLVLTVLTAQFRRTRLAFLVLVSVPVALSGGLGALLVTKTPLNASSLMGCVLLVGLVVKNGVLLLEEAEKECDRGAEPRLALVHAASRRLRPILMTTLATLAGLLPLALGIGAGAEVQRPLAIAVIGGLSASTLATLGLLPPLAAAVLPRTPRE